MSSDLGPIPTGWKQETEKDKAEVAANTNTLLQYKYKYALQIQNQGGCLGDHYVLYSAPGGSLQEEVGVGGHHVQYLCPGCGGTRGWQRWPS